MSTIEDVEYGDEPFSPLTELSDRMLAVIPEESKIKAIVFLVEDDPDDEDMSLGGIGISGYDGPEAAIADLLFHLKAMLATNGTQMLLLTDDGFHLADEVPDARRHD